MDISSLRERPAGGSFSPSELNEYIKNIFDSERTLRAVTVRGEISNFTRHTTGHLYFSLKDADGQIRAVMFRSAAGKLAFLPESGMRVIVHGTVSVYPRDGSYQIYVNSMQPDGIGALYLAYEQLKRKLAEEGLFDEYHKRQLPDMPMRIGVITSPTGAAVRDVINVTGRRFPLAEVFIYPALVQGEGAEASLVSAVDYFDKTKLCDVIIIGRGGGSIEDLWAFNSEKLARRIYESDIPIVSAVGHETDFTICDFVADMRAPTPSAAAELVVPDIRAVMMRIDDNMERAGAALRCLTEKKREKLLSLLDNKIFKAPNTILESRNDALSESEKRACELISNILLSKRGDFAIAASKLQALSPLAVLSRGYTVIEHDGAIVKTKNSLKNGDKLKLRFYDGEAAAYVTEV